MMYAKHTTNVRGSYDFWEEGVLFTELSWRHQCDDASLGRKCLSAWLCRPCSYHGSLSSHSCAPLLETFPSRGRSRELEGGVFVSQKGGVGGADAVFKHAISNQKHPKSSSWWSVLPFVFLVVFFLPNKGDWKTDITLSASMYSVSTQKKKKTTCRALYRLPFLKLFQSIPTSMTLVPGLIKMLNYPLCETT